MRFVADFIGALREAGLPVSPAESLDALNAIKLMGLEQRQTSKTVLALTLVKRQADRETYDELFDLYFGQNDKASDNDELNDELNKNPIDEKNSATTESANQTSSQNSDNGQSQK